MFSDLSTRSRQDRWHLHLHLAERGRCCGASSSANRDAHQMPRGGRGSAVVIWLILYSAFTRLVRCELDVAAQRGDKL